MPTPKSNDEYAVLRESETNGANYDLDTPDIIARLKQWKTLCSFRIMGAESDTVDIEFETLPKEMDAFVKDLYDFCPDLVDQGTGCVGEMVEMAQETGEEIPAKLQELIKGVDFTDENYGLEILKRELQRDRTLKLWWD
ncbi:MAG: hypothetical protein JWR69_3620 [Pedosphaera sp.]|nr:hypothetical protein [Pedosphaera sp.]